MLRDRVAALLLMPGALLLAGCASSSIGPDLSRVRELSRAPTLPRLAEAEAEPEGSRDAAKMLGEPLDADAAVRIALLNNRELRAQLRELGVPRGRLIQAGLVANPVVEVESLPERNAALELRVEYDITSLVLAPLRAHAAEAELETARYQVAGAVVQLGYDVRVAFYAVEATEQRLGIAQRALDTLAAARDAAAALLASGSMPPLEASTQIAAYERSRITVAQLELELSERRERVHRLLGAFAGETGWSVRTELAAVPEDARLPDRPESRAIQASLDLASMRSRLEAVARRTGLSRTQGWLPDIAADVHALHGAPDLPAASTTDGRWAFGGGVRVGLPIFDRQQGNTRAHEAEFDGLLERYQGLAIDVRSAVREAGARVASARARARQFQKIILPAQRTVVEQTLLAYNAMQVGVFQLLQARREELEMQLAYVETLREHWSAVAALDAILAGRRVSPMMASPPASMPMGAGSESAGEH